MENPVTNHLKARGFEVEPLSENDPTCSLKFMQINCWTIAWDETGRAWKHRGYVDPGDYFSKISPNIVPSSQ